MLGYLLVRPDPYFAVSDKTANSRLRICRPERSWSFKFGTRKPAYVKKASIDGKDAAWKNAGLSTRLSRGDNTLAISNLTPRSSKD